MITLSIDHGTTSGYAVFEHTDKEVKLINSGFVYFNSNTKYNEIYKEYNALFDKTNPDLISLEKINLRGTKFNADAILRLCEIRAMIKLIADERDIECIEANPLSMKKLITGHGHGTKYQVAKEVCLVFEKNFDEIPKIRTKNPLYDECDAIALGYYNICKYYSLLNKTMLNRIYVRNEVE